MSLKNELDRIRYEAQFEQIVNWKKVFNTTYALVVEQIKKDCHPRYCSPNNVLEYYKRSLPTPLNQDDGIHKEEIVRAVCEKLRREGVDANFINEPGKFGIEIHLSPLPEYVDVFSE